MPRFRKKAKARNSEDHLHLPEEGFWGVTKASALLEEENQMFLEGENALNEEFVRSERFREVYREFRTKMEKPVKQLPNGFATKVAKWQVEAKDLLADLNDSEDIVNSDLDDVERKLDGARKRFEGKHHEIAGRLKEADELKKDRRSREEFQAGTDEVRNFKTSKNVQLLLDPQTLRHIRGLHVLPGFVFAQFLCSQVSWVVFSFDAFDQQSRNALDP